MWSKVSDPSHGTVSVNADGTFEYTPEADYNGTDSFTYTITDADGDTSTATVNLTVDPMTDELDDANESVSTNEDTAISGNVLDNVTDADSDSHSVTSFTVSGTTYNAGETATLSEGSLTIAADGGYTFTPADNFNGDVPQVSYGIVDNNDANDTDTSTLDISVDAVNDAPVAVDDSASTTEDTAVTISAADLLSNDSDIDG
ncbi:hypothetical protein AVO41_00005, partial [Thiomicrospira sp. WB1]